MKEPLLDDDLSEKDERPMRLFSTRIMVVGSVLLFFGLIFKIQHWPMNALMIVIGCGIASGSAAYRGLALPGSPVERAMRMFVPILTICILFFWLQYTWAAVGLFAVAGLIAAAVDHTKIKNR